ncbi:DUF4097 domain-containing protein [Hymenobacter sp. RP-2-7]|uniref:DUF4097 domain-containing protein n=1 Tax=Hymenobacter polaris TaxID=2682546 RepID=A0A7Y0AC31_9BACT|nr:DUF4097 family beta strand repeat-containing protein [Hymenobacter polaris]NML64596.1 DUF4097 domain-containing protein [Hymenobacter polaris]
MKSLLLTFLLLPALGAAQLAQAQRLVTQTAPLAAGQAVALELKYAHQIRVRPGTGKELTVKAQVTIADHDLDQTYDLAVTTTSTEVQVEEKLDKEQIARYWKHSWRDGNDGRHTDGDNALRIDYEITLPAATPLTLRTVSGDIDAQDLTGAVTVKSISGRLQLAGLSGPVQARAISGDIRLTGLPGRAPVSAESISGNVDASWPPTREAELTLKSLTGEVYADSAVTFSNRRERRYVGYSLRGHTGRAEGGPLVSLSSISGDVFFRQR